MQDMDVVKKGSTSWLWIVIALAAEALILWLTMGGGRTRTSQTGQSFAPTTEGDAVTLVAAA